jgi:Mg-chelatase subunit ChlD
MLALVLLAGCGPSSGAGDADSSESSSRDMTPYRSEVDEGLGVALDIVLDNSGSMADIARGDNTPKSLVARAAIARMLDATDSAIAQRPDFPVLIAVHVFSEDVRNVLPMQPYNRDSVSAALARVGRPVGGTAIGRGIDEARKALYRSGVFRKNILVVTDGENTSGPSPRTVTREIFERSEGGVRMYFVAFDVDADKFAFVRSVKGEVIAAANAPALGAALDSLYQGRVLAEALDAGEGRVPPPSDSTARTKPPGRDTSDLRPRSPRP